MDIPYKLDKAVAASIRRTRLAEEKQTHLLYKPQRRTENKEGLVPAISVTNSSLYGALET